MNDSDFQFLAAELNLPENRIRKVAALFEDGATVPFIARYRKEVSGGMDEVVLLRLREAVEQLRKVNERRGICWNRSGSGICLRASLHPDSAPRIL